MRDIQYWVIVGMLIGSSILSWRLYFKVYRQEDTVDITSFPMEIDGWSAQEIAISEYEYAILETKNVFVRKYTKKGGQEVYLFVVYSQNNRKVSHPPEICYAGGGVTILDKQLDFIPASGGLNGDIAANRLTIEKGNFQQSVFYWFKVGSSYTSNYWKQQGLIALKSFLGQPASSALIRISATIKEGDASQSVADIKSFGSIILPYLQKHLP